MNNSNLLSLIKTLVNEAHHSARYNRKGGVTTRLKVPDKTKQLAEDDDETDNKNPGKTDTGQRANFINRKPQYNSQMTAASGHKPQIDSK